MIYKNDFGCNVIQFGTGDIEVGNGRVMSNDEKEMFPCCTFVEKPAGEIGALCHPESKDDPAEEREDIHTAFVFTDVRSVQVVIDHLEEVKERFKRNGSKILSMQEITDEI